ncbi:DUF4349 domain-containing protein [Streptomyces sp. NPDC092296]|uniref:DUF4349 domain-containing protein n=1 Tax=Streptomyces sp. NPDC092296 TaxID=3366012 RepID=UPI003813A6D4
MRGRATTVAGGLLLAAVALLGSGCSAGADSTSAPAADRAAVGAAKDRAAPLAPPSAGAGTGAGTATGSPVAAQRSIAYSAELRIEAKDVSAVLAQLHSLATDAGGYVSGETMDGAVGTGPDESGESGGGRTWVEGDVSGYQAGAQLVVKVPSAAFDRTLDGFGRLGKVLALHRKAEDVTDQVVDVQSRVKTQRASVDRVRKLMDQAETITEVVSLESELSHREADLESLEQQLQQLASQTSLSTITVQVQSAAAPAPVPPRAGGAESFGTAVADALAGGWHALYATVRVLLVVLAAVAPFAVVLVPAGWLALRVARRRRERESAGPVAARPEQARPQQARPQQTEPEQQREPVAQAARSEE